MIANRRSWLLLVALTALLLVSAFAFFGTGTSAPGGASASDLVPVPIDARVVGTLGGNPVFPGEEDLPPESTLSYRGGTVSSDGEVLGSWEPPGLFSSSHGSGIRDRTAVPLTLTDGDLLEVSKGATLSFRYGGETEWGDVFDATAFRLEDGELLRAQDVETSVPQYLSAKPGSRPAVLSIRVPEVVGQETVGVRMEVPPGFYVVSVSASVEEGNVRYGFRVVVE